MNRLRGLAAALRASFVVHLDCVAVHRSDTLKNSGESVSLPVSQPDRAEVKRHFGSASQSATLVNATDRAFDNRAFVLTGLAHRHRKTVALLCLLCSELIVQNRYQYFTVAHDEFSAGRGRVIHDQPPIVVQVPLSYISSSVINTIDDNRLSQPVGIDLPPHSETGVVFSCIKSDIKIIFFVAVRTHY